MAASLNMSDPVTLAHKILSSTSEERLALLRAFYVGQNPALEQLFTLPEKTPVPATPAPKQKVLRARRRGKTLNKPNAAVWLSVFLQCSVKFILQLA